MISLKKVGRWYVFEEELDEKLTSVLFKSLSYMKKGANFLPNPLFGMVYLYNRKKRCFPAGLLPQVLEILEEWKKQKGKDYKVIGSGEKLILFGDMRELRDYQQKAVSILSLNHGGIISIPTGGGKSLIGVQFLENQDYRTKKLILVPTKDLVNQWKEQLTHVKNCFVTTYQYAYRHLDILEDYEFVICDECHHVSAKTLYKVGMGCKKAIMVGLTATPRRDDGEDMKMNGVLGPIIYEVAIQDLVAQGYLLPATVKMVDMPKEANHDTLFDEYKDSVNFNIVHGALRNSKITDIAFRESEHGTVLIMVDFIEHGQLLYDVISKNKDKRVVFVNSQSKNRDEIFQTVLQEGFDIVIATSVYGEGVSINCLRTLVLAGGGKGTIKILQRIGRLLRNYKDKSRAIIYDFDDKGRWLKNHTKKRVEIYQKNNFTVEMI